MVVLVDKLVASHDVMPLVIRSTFGLEGFAGSYLRGILRNYQIPRFPQKFPKIMKSD